MDRPSLDHVLDHLARHGVHEVVLSSSYLEETFHAFIEARHGDPAITWITETEPLGTGGAIVNALEALDTDEPFLALNGDILTDLDLTAMLALHRERGAAATIALTHVEDARPVRPGPDRRRRARARVPREARPSSCPATSTRAPTCSSPRRSRAGRAGENVSIERADLPRADRRGPPALRVPLRRVLDGPRDAREVPAGALRPARRQGGGPPRVPRAVRRRRRRASTGRAPWTARRRRAGAPTIGAGAQVSDSVLHDAARWSSPTRSSSARSSGPGSSVDAGRDGDRLRARPRARSWAPAPRCSRRRVRPGERIEA